MNQVIPMLMRALAVVAATACLAPMASAQDFSEPKLPDFYLGLYGGYGLVSHSAMLRAQLLNPRATVPDEGALREGSGAGLLAGIAFELPFSSAFSLGLRAGFQERGGILERTYTNTDDVSGADAAGARVRGSLDAGLAYLTLTPLVKVTPTELPLYLLAGPTLLYNLSGTYTYTETIESPADARFRDNDRRTHTVARGDLPATALVPALTAGLGTDLSLGGGLGLFLELQFSPTLSDVIENGEWTNSSLALVGGLRFGLFSEPEPVRPVVSRDTVRTVDVRRMRAGAIVDDTTLSSELVISGRTVRATEAYAFLPWVFFPRDSASIPDRYIAVDRRAVRAYDIGRIERGDAIRVYHHVLNIIGQRLRDMRQAKVTVTGCSSNAEGTDTALSRRRAEAVRDYLVEVWRINKNRIEVEARGLPSLPSLSEVDTAESDRENQRVEFSSTHYEVLAPVRLPDTLLLAPAGTVRFFPPTSLPAGADSWALNVMVGDSLIENVATGFGEPPTSLDFVLRNRPDLFFAAPTPIVGRLIVRDSMYNEVASVWSDTVMIRQTGTNQELRDVVAGKVVDTYNLLLYSFDSDAILDFTQQATVLMQSKVTDASTVRVIGHTDRTGLPYYNQALSVRRAEIASQNLGVPLRIKEVTGLGEKRLLYDNTLPEGRYYCRTVTVIIETPAATADVTQR